MSTQAYSYRAVASFLLIVSVFAACGELPTLPAE
jgi:hypothetical protein